MKNQLETIIDTDAGYMAYNGYIFTSADAALYNKYNNEISAIIERAGDNPSKSMQRLIDDYLEKRHAVFLMIINQNQHPYYIIDRTMCESDSEEGVIVASFGCINDAYEYRRVNYAWLERHNVKVVRA
jgi:hypothetical protein